LHTDVGDTRIDVRNVTRLHESFEAQVARTPGAAALVFEDHQLTYRQLDLRANQLAHQLRSLGVGPEVLVGLSIERSLELVIGLFGILKAGGAYVPLDPEYPSERLAFMLTDAQAPVLLTQEHLKSRLPSHDAHVVCLDGDWDAIAEHSDAKPAEQTIAENLAYVIYTSGSTGRPKGAMNEHRGICNRLFWMQDEYRLTPADTVLQKTPFSFDVSVWEFFWPMMTGARLVLARPGGHKDASYLARLIEEQQVTVLHFVPSMLQVFLDEPDLEQRCGSLRDVICSGEALSYDLQERFFSRLDARLHNLYGPTEAAVDVTYWECQRGGKERVVPIGRPVANTQIHVLDEELRPVPVGTPGELHIGGVQVGRGYWNRPELTAERFIPDPFRDAPDARLYKTGDLARYRADGAVEFLGRIDFQVKIRGNRVELGEIEAVLESHAGVKQAVVMAREDEPGDQRLVAYLVAASGRPPTVSELRRHVEETLPDYMVPSAYCVLESMPLSPNGKVDRRALPEPDRGRPELDQVYVAPRNELETLLTEIWCDVLGFDRVGVHDRFFELGGSSLQAAQFINRVQKELGEFIYVVTIFESPTVAEYAAFLRRDYAESVARRLGEVRPARTESVARDREPEAAARIDVDAVERMRAAIPVRPRWDGEEAEAREPKNPPALFILSPPRSGTTLLRVMLAGHPSLFAAAELQLLGFNTLQERRAAFSGKYSLWLEGTVRAVMELKDCDGDGAKQIMEEYEREGCTTKQFYRLLQESLGEKMLVDKSPAYVLDMRTLEKAERDFENALYIHLVRHPYAMTRSFEGYHMDQVLFLEQHPFTRRQLGELVWTISQQNTLEFLRNVPEHRQYRMRFEDMVNRPREIMEEMCVTLGLEYYPTLVEPYRDIDKKMTDGIYKDSTPMGDTKLLERRTIDPKVADSWRGVLTDDFLGDVTWDLAVSLGYDPPPAGEAVAGGAARRREFSAQREELRKRRERRRQVSQNNEEQETVDG
jgi:amino acid adenylation domain-containing protein